MLKTFAKYLDDVAMILGCVCLVYGVSLVYVPAAWITMGILLVTGAFMYGRSA
jgi:hypothetical protein